MKKVSVIIPVYNEERYIEECLLSVLRQTYQIYEIIIVNDGSTDKTVPIINKIKKQYISISIKIIKQKHSGPAIARNMGADIAHGQIFIFLDADMVYDKKYIALLVDPIINNNEIATTAGDERVNNLDNHWARYWDKVTFNNQGRRVVPHAYIRDGTFRAIKAKEFQKSGGFDSFGHTDDQSVLAKLNKTSKCIDDALCYHFNPETLSEVFYSARWMGRNKDNRLYLHNLLIYSFSWSLLKAILGTVKNKSLSFLPFRLIFDLGYFIGLIDLYNKGVHYK